MLKIDKHFFHPLIQTVVLFNFGLNSFTTTENFLPM